MEPLVRPTVPTGVCKYCIVCVSTLPLSTVIVLTFIMTVVLYVVVWPLTVLPFLFWTQQ